MTDRPELDAAIAAVAESSGGPADLKKALTQITDIAHGSVRGVDFASVTIRHRAGRLETVAPSSPLLYVADGLQYEINEGPCYDAVTDDLVMYCPDLAHDCRWPQFGPRAAMLGLSSLLCVRLIHPGVALMSLNLYSDTVGAFDDHQRVARLFAKRTAGATVAELRGNEDRSPHAFLNGQTTIDHATGILMQRHGIGAKRALDLLHQLAEHRYGSRED